MATVLVGTFMQGTAAVAVDPSTLRPSVPQASRPVAVHTVPVTPRKASALHAPKAPARSWPVSGTAGATVPGSTGRATLGSLPVALRAPRSATAPDHGDPAALAARSAPVRASVTVASRAAARRAGVDGLLLSVRRSDAVRTAGATGLEVDYAKYAQAYGGDYGSRLRLERLPACALTTPGKAACRTGEPVTAVNDTEHGTLTADSVPLAAAPAPTAATAGKPASPAATSAALAPATVLALTTGASGDHGDYTATKLSPSSTWSTDMNTGDFSWSYNMPVPAVPGGLEPTVGLSYSSSDIDGRTSTTNNQSSWVGDGFDMWPGFIERDYKDCADDGITINGNKPGDLCWGFDNATLSFNGHSGTLVPAGNDTWKLRDDDGTRIEHLNGSANGAGDNGDNDKEYWRVTTTDGTQYYFGYDKLPGWSSGKTETNSTWNVPVFGDDTGEPCHASTFAASYCQQAYRWNLDYAVDTHGNAVAYYYNKETNFYGRALTASNRASYDRGGTLDHIDYGLRSDTVYSAKALGQVSFTSAERCIPETGVTCDASTIDTKSSYWYDTPYDQNCKSGTDCTGQFSPTFWTRKRLTGVTASVLNSGGTYTAVDSWAFTQGWGMSDIDYQLLLTSVQHTGNAPATGSAVSLPPVTFSYTQRPNRLDQSGDGTAPFIMERLSTVDDETGGQTDVAYSTPVCDAAHLPTPETNTTRCYPDYFTKSGDANPSLQWFNKYVVDSVTETDRTTHAPDAVTKYFYPEDAAWHYDDDDGLTKEKYKTWSQWRGYGHVEEETGGQSGMDSRTDHYFLRGMDGDRLNTSGGTKSVTVSDQEGTTLTDHPAYAGFEYRTEDYSGPTGNILTKTVNHPWSQQTASETHTWGTVTADMTGTADTSSYASLDNGAGSSWRQSETFNTYDSHGRITQVDDAGQVGVSGDSRCTKTTYADNTTANIMTLPSRVVTYSVACSTTPDRTKDVVSDVRTAYDGSDYTAAPTKGDAYYVASLKSDDGTTTAYLESGTTFDTYGRKLNSTDITADVTVGASGTVTRTPRTDGLTTTTAYSPTSGIPTSSTVTTPPLTTGQPTTAFTTTTTLDPYRGQPLSVSDPNSKLTSYAYDTLGRVLDVWLPDRSKAGGQTPDHQYSYTITDGSPVVVASKTLKNDGTQEASYTIYDGMLRARQTQAPGPSGGRLLTDTFYDERGLNAKSFAAYYATGAPSATLLAPDDATGVETQTWATYDGLGRETKVQQAAGDGDGATVLNTTTTTYGGDRVTVVPPTGGTPTTTFTDVRGQTTALWQYHGATATGTHDTTTYTYTPSGKPDTLTDTDGSVWSYTYDQAGRQHTAVDPDRGTTTFTYDDRGRVLTAKDADNNVLAYVYDTLGRKTEEHSGSATGPELASWAYDTVSGAKGQLASSTRYDSGNQYTTAVNIYDSLYRVTRATTTVPAAEGALQGAYQVNTKYNLDGTVQSTGYPAAGALPAEAVVDTYDVNHRLTQATGTTSYLTGMTYSLTGLPEQYQLGVTGGQSTWLTQGYEFGTQRLSTSRVDREGFAGVDRSDTYGYDAAGNVLSIADVSRDGTDRQCFTYDGLQRLTEAWAQDGTTSSCAATPSASATGGPAPYWQSFGYDAVGDRTSETDHGTGAQTGTDLNHSYVYPAATAAQPHAATEIDTNTAPDPAVYHYDADGNTTSRPSGTGQQQTLTWNTEGLLATVKQPNASGGTDTTSYLYDADGNRLIQRAPTGTTLYTGGQEITLATGAGTPTATRYYDLGGGLQAVRTNDNTVSFTIPDALGTGDLAVNATTLDLQQRRTTPFGATRGSPPATWPGDKGFVGGTNDPTGLTQLGARAYDQTTGRFISLDPVLDTGDPQSLNGYAYADNSPVTKADPDGRRLVDPDTGCQGNAESISACITKREPAVEKAEKEEKQQNAWVKMWSPSTNNARDLMRDWNVSTRPQGAPYWDNQVGGAKAMENTCFGMKGCQEAYIHLLNNPDDIAGAKEIAATYCAIHTKLCASDAKWTAYAQNVVGQIPFLLAGGEDGEAGGADPAPVPCRSFSADTRVLLADGRTKKIGDVQPGDRVEAGDPETGKHVGPRTVTAKAVHHDTDLVDLTVRNPDGHTAVLHTTANHPVWDDTLHVWVYAGHLKPGHALETATDTHAHVVLARPVTGAADMDNLTVDQLHTYYVLEGGTPVLVHNAPGCGEWDVPNVETLDGTWARMGFGTRSEFGDAAWGGRSLSDASLLKTPEQVAKMREIGMTRQDAQYWRNFYQDINDKSVARWPNNPEKVNPSAGSRADLFQYYMNHLGE